MAIILPQGLQITSKQPVDTRILLKKSAMLTIDDNTMPSKYFAVCMDDGKIYLYDKNNEMDAETGKFRILTAEADLSGVTNDINNIKTVLFGSTVEPISPGIVNTLNEIKNNYVTKTELEEKLQELHPVDFADLVQNKEVTIILGTGAANTEF